jgi:hypothetical protein
MTTIARQIPQARRVFTALTGGPRANGCVEQTDAEDKLTTVANTPHSRRAAQAEYAWVHSAADAGLRLPRG